MQQNVACRNRDRRAPDPPGGEQGRQPPATSRPQTEAAPVPGRGAGPGRGSARSPLLSIGPWSAAPRGLLPSPPFREGGGDRVPHGDSGREGDGKENLWMWAEAPWREGAASQEPGAATGGGGGLGPAGVSPCLQGARGCSDRHRGRLQDGLRDTVRAAGSPAGPGRTRLTPPGTREMGPQPPGGSPTSHEREAPTRSQEVPCEKNGNKHQKGPSKDKQNPKKDKGRNTRSQRRSHVVRRSQLQIGRRRPPYVSGILCKNASSPIDGFPNAPIPASRERRLGA